MSDAPQPFAGREEERARLRDIDLDAHREQIEEPPRRPVEALAS